MMKASKFFLAASIFALASSQTLAAVCPDKTPVEGHLNWALQHDDVFNEGAECGLSILSKIAGYPVPPIRIGVGNVFKRPEMMKAAIAVYHMGYIEEAINVATCSQIHNTGAYQCLTQNRAAVQAWLSVHFI